MESLHARPQAPQQEQPQDVVLTIAAEGATQATRGGVLPPVTSALDLATAGVDLDADFAASVHSDRSDRSDRSVSSSGGSCTVAVEEEHIARRRGGHVRVRGHGHAVLPPHAHRIHASVSLPAAPGAPPTSSRHDTRHSKSVGVLGAGVGFRDDVVLEDNDNDEDSGDDDDDDADADDDGEDDGDDDDALGSVNDHYKRHSRLHGAVASTDRHRVDHHTWRAEREKQERASAYIWDDRAEKQLHTWIGVAKLNTVMDELVSMGLRRYHRFAVAAISVLTVIVGSKGIDSLIQSNNSWQDVVAGLCGIFLGVIVGLMTNFEWKARADAHKKRALRYANLATMLDIQVTLQKHERQPKVELFNSVPKMIEAADDLAEPVPLNMRAEAQNTTGIVSLWGGSDVYDREGKTAFSKKLRQLLAQRI